MAFYVKCGCGLCDKEILIGETREEADETFADMKAYAESGALNDEFNNPLIASLFQLKLIEH